MEKKSERVQKLQVQYWQTILGVREEDFVFIDEAGVNLALIRLYARAIKGQRARGTKPQKRGKNVSMIGAVALRGIIASVNVYGSSDGITFEAFVINKLVPRLWKGACVVLDNSTIHKGDEVRSAMQSLWLRSSSSTTDKLCLCAVGAKLVFLSPYSPEFNPIENLWSKLKSILRSFGARTYKALDEAIALAYAQISEDNIRNWFAHCCYCTSSN